MRTKSFPRRLLSLLSLSSADVICSTISCNAWRLCVSARLVAICLRRDLHFHSTANIKTQAITTQKIAGQLIAASALEFYGTRNVSNLDLSRRKQEIFGSNSDYEIPCTAKTYGGSEAAKTGSLKLGGMRIADAKINFDRRTQCQKSVHGHRPAYGRLTPYDAAINGPTSPRQGSPSTAARGSFPPDPAGSPRSTWRSQPRAQKMRGRWPQRDGDQHHRWCTDYCDEGRLALLTSVRYATFATNAASTVAVCAGWDAATAARRHVGDSICETRRCDHSCGGTDRQACAL
jgi:hypothetical protein